MASVTDYIDTRDGIFDSRAVIDRIAEIEAEIIPTDDWDGSPLHHIDADTDEELRTLRAFAAEMASQGPADWQYGEAFIADYAFERYAQELAEDIGAIPSEYGWPASHIDWPEAADALKQDYTSVEIDGTTWWYRA